MYAIFDSSVFEVEVTGCQGDLVNGKFMEVNSSYMEGKTLLAVPIVESERRSPVKKKLEAKYSIVE